VETQNLRGVAAQCSHRLDDSREAGVAVAVLLGEDRNLFRPQPPYLHQVLDDGVSLLGVARSVIENVAIGRLTPQQSGAGEGSEEQHLLLQRIWQRYDRGRGPDIADEPEDGVLVDELLHRLNRSGRLVPIVNADEAKLAAMDSAGRIHRAERRVEAELHLPPKLL